MEAKRRLTVILEDLKVLYPHNISLYKIPPSDQVIYSEFEDLAIDRLKALGIIGFASKRGYKQYGNEWKKFIYEELEKHNLKHFLRLVKWNCATNPSAIEYQARRADHISHFILRLAFCHTRELREWFLVREVELFELRFTTLSALDVADFIEYNNLPYKAVTEQEKLKLRDKLYESTAGDFDFNSTTFYKVSFTKVGKLVRARNVFVQGGFAYVPIFEMVHFVSTIFRAHLKETLMIAFHNLPELGIGIGINKVLENLEKIYTIEFKENESGFSTNLINLNSEKHFPLCISHIHNIFKSTHHLRHGCRLQYLLFLKGIGVNFEDCLRYWREEFTKKIEEDKFDKRYSYSIKHAYGKVGRMQEHRPYSCMRIIENDVRSNEQHGCPYKHWDSAHLKDRLLQDGINPEGANEIVETAKKGDYQTACGKCFKFKHDGLENKNGINSPHQYFTDGYTLDIEDFFGSKFLDEPNATNVPDEILLDTLHIK